MRRMHIPVALTALMLVIGLGGCSGAVPRDDTSATQTSSEVATPTTEQSPSAAPMPPVDVTEMPTPDVTTPQAISDYLAIFYVALADGGQSGPEIGCGDSLVMAEVQETGITAFNQIELAIQQMLEVRNQYFGQSGLYNALAQSSLTYVSSYIDGDLVTVNLTGTVVSSGICDDERIIQQLSNTAMAAAGVGDAKILVDSVPIEQLIGGRG